MHILGCAGPYPRAQRPQGCRSIFNSPWLGSFLSPCREHDGLPFHFRGGIVKLNRRQKDGIADSLEKIGVAAAIGFIVGVFVEAKITFTNAAILLLTAVVFIAASVTFRGDRDD